jgi:NAD(P)-dependent dehydrogenase (short-subunit alcohol dehydrogenase family)
MARLFITGSSDGLGNMSAKLLISQGHQVVLHARNAQRAEETKDATPGAEQVLIGDLSNLEQTKKLADDVNQHGSFDAVIHNAGVYRESSRIIFTVNTLAPYVLTCLIQKPKRLIYLSSGLHKQGDASLKNFDFENGQISYSDSKLHNVILCMAVARKWPDVFSNAVNPGWVPTKMGGRGAPDNLDKGAETQAWLAVSNDDKAKVSGRYFRYMKVEHHQPEVDDINLQEKFIELCEKTTGITFPSFPDL